MNRADLTATALVLQDAILSGYDYDRVALLDPIVEHVHDTAKLIGLAEGHTQLASVFR